ncbi:uncharacterized protein LOC133920501 [Phragmites australis]|uniref:uncharacterized protein LOC133920501 n=1 Tax=Phragmites australis TaxID=29695 RepID=UPI002D792D59|nr:uncharacterized protein LOC133920501 [Phragmites australis]
MTCRRASSNVLMVLLAISLLAVLDRPIAHAGHVKDPSMSTGEHSSTEKGLQGRRKPGMENTKRTETVGVTGSTGTGAQNSVGPNFGHGASSEFAEVVVERYGPRPHPKKHN